MIELSHVSRWYGQVIGLNDVSCRVGPGLTALLGPNGAGKSTLFKLITGQMRPTTGSVKLLGEAPFANGRVLRGLGYCPEIDNFYEEMTGREFVTQLAAMSGLSGGTLTKRVNESIDRVGMADRCDRKLGGYSKGMRQRIKVAQAIVHEPQVLILDEPLNGLDPVGRRDLTDLMMEYAQAGKCVIVSSHILYEVEALTEAILLMQRGRLLAEGSIHGIRDLMDRHPHKITLHLAPSMGKDEGGRMKDERGNAAMPNPSPATVPQFHLDDDDELGAAVAPLPQAANGAVATIAPAVAPSSLILHPSSFPSDTRALARDLLVMPSVLGVRFDTKDPNRLEVETARPDQFYAALPELVLAGGYAVDGFASPDNSLEAVLKYLLG